MSLKPRLKPARRIERRDRRCRHRSRVSIPRVAPLGALLRVSPQPVRSAPWLAEDRKARSRDQRLMNDIGLIEAQQHRHQRAALEARLKAETVDVTLPVRFSAPRPPRAAFTPFPRPSTESPPSSRDMGSPIAEGPAISRPTTTISPRCSLLEGHPAREMHDTFEARPGRGEEGRNPTAPRPCRRGCKRPTSAGGLYLTSSAGSADPRRHARPHLSQ